MRHNFMFYFGCINVPGHYLWSSPTDRWSAPFASENDARLWPLPWSPGELDGGLQPGSEAWLNHEPRAQKGEGLNYKDGEAYRHVRQGWVAVAYWDRTVDKRMGSCSVLLLGSRPGVTDATTCTVEDIVKLFKLEWPGVVRCDVKELRS